MKMHNLSNLLSIVIGIGLCLFLQSCGGDKASIKTAATAQVKTYMATSLDCEYQKNIAKSQRMKLVIFDPTGIFPEELYAKSPSHKIQHDILAQTDFRNWAEKKFDLFFATQDCPEGQYLTKEYHVTNYPTILLINKDDGRVLYKRDQLLSLDDLHRDLKLII